MTAPGTVTESPTADQPPPRRPAAAEVVWAAAVGGVALTGVALARALDRPVVAVGVLVAAIVVPLLWRRPRAILAVLVVLQVGNVAAFLGEHGLPGTSAAFVLVAGAVVVADAVRGRGRPVVVGVLGWFLVFLAIRGVSAVGAPDQAAASGTLVDLTRDVVVVALMLALCVNHRGERVVAGAAVATTAVVSVLEILRQFVVGNAVTFGGFLHPAVLVDVGLNLPRHTGPVVDFNFWGRILLLAAPFALALFADRTTGRRRWWWMVAFAAIVGGLYLTGSRGVLLGSAVVVVVWMLVSGHRYRRLLPLIPAVLVLALLVPGVGSRIATISDTTTTNVAEQDYSLTGRLSTFDVGLGMVRDRPWSGVGAGNYTAAFPSYQQAAGIDGPVLDAHNLYLQYAAESGLPGLAAYLLFFGAGVTVAVRARCLWRWRRPDSEPDGPTLLAAAAIASFAGWAVVGLTLHAENFHVYAIPLVVAASLDLRARRALVTELGADRWRTALLTDLARRAPRPRPRPRPLLPAVVVMVVALVGLPPAGIVSRSWTATSEVRVVAGAPAAATLPYAAEVLSRRPLGSTYLQVVAGPGVLADAAAVVPGLGQPGHDVVVSLGTEPTQLLVTAAAPDPDLAARSAEAVARAGVARFAAENAFYTLRWISTDAPQPRWTVSGARLGALAAVALLSGAAAALVRARAPVRTSGRRR